jgi:hypothetical protein
MYYVNHIHVILEPLHKMSRELNCTYIVNTHVSRETLKIMYRVQIISIHRFVTISIAGSYTFDMTMDNTLRGENS